MAKYSYIILDVLIGKIRKIRSKLRDYVSPHIHIFIVCNDNIFLSSFLKDLKITIPHTLIKYKGGELFLEDTFIQNPGKKNICVIISDYTFETQENLFPLNGVEIFDVIEHTAPETDFLLLYNNSDEEKAIEAIDERNIYPIKKNTHSHIRAQSYIHTLYNVKNISLQHELNRKLFIGVGIVLICIFTTLAISCF